MNAIARERKCKLKLLRCPHNTRKTKAKESQGEKKKKRITGCCVRRVWSDSGSQKWLVGV